MNSASPAVRLYNAAFGRRFRHDGVAPLAAIGSSAWNCHLNLKLLQKYKSLKESLASYGARPTKTGGNASAR